MLSPCLTNQPSPLPLSLKMMRVAKERKPLDINDERFVWFCEEVNRETDKLLAAADEGYIF
jgi:hypothetical protein